MQDKMMDAFNAQTRQMFEPMRKINSLMLNNMEKMTQYQLEAMKRYSQMGTERIRNATDVQDAESLRDFGTQQAAMMNELSQQMQEDARVMSEMSLEFKAEMEKLFGEAGKQMADQASSAAKGEQPAKASSQSSRKS
ncbi:phasin family protein [Halomonas sp. HL-93]|uniref:phasin family protein n=1 Tax=Halomonas sp. HL-93 TaxID=1666906 RepID=UPI00047F1EB1|nr:MULTISPECIES: phasin family protein [unclassified Halomonas]KPQ24148.1 MAG: phasin family protein [Halomonas sp. HL-48]KPQ24808.1 MAG: phasin family protein [Halomonas sp. HL-93]SBR47541.1 phasin family protein [Halomonas sp. HL-93]